LTTRETLLHQPVNAGPDDEDDFRRCGDCATDLMSITVCPNAPLARCGCPLYALQDGDSHATWGCDADGQ
jgi:hypothetical protein